MRCRFTGVGERKIKTRKIGQICFGFWGALQDQRNVADRLHQKRSGLAAGFCDAHFPFAAIHACKTNFDEFVIGKRTLNFLHNRFTQALVGYHYHRLEGMANGAKSFFVAGGQRGFGVAHGVVGTKRSGAGILL